MSSNDELFYNKIRALRENYYNSHKEKKKVNPSYIHGLSEHRLFRIWSHMKDRCYNPKNDSFHNYGAKGIRICNRWLNSFSNFYNWAIKSGYEENLTIDRKNVKGNYSPSNCRWVTRKVQGNNRSTNRVLIHNGISKTMQEWSEYTGLKYTTIKLRLLRGWDVPKTLTTPS